MRWLLPSVGVGRVQGLDLAVRQASWNTFAMAILPGVGSGIVWHPVSPAPCSGSCPPSPARGSHSAEPGARSVSGRKSRS